MTQHRGLGIARRAAGKQQDGNFIPGFRQVDFFGGRPGHEFGLEVAPRDEGDAVGWRNAGQHVVVDDQHRRRASRDELVEFAVRETIVERNEGRPGHAAREEQHGQRSAIHPQKGGVRLVLRREPCCDRAGAGAIGSEIITFLAAAERGAIGTGIGGDIEEQRRPHICQSEAGSGLAPLIAMATPLKASEPAPALAPSTSSPLASST